MKIKILGTRGEIEPALPKHSKHSGVLIDEKIMFDIGEKEFLKYKPKAIFITHLHPDHAFFVLKGNINRFRNKSGMTATRTFAPEKLKDGPEIKIIKEKTKIDGYTITPIFTHHSKLVKSCAYIIEKKPDKILYTGDVIWIDKKYHSKLKNLDLVITEASFIRKGGMIRRDKKTGQIYGHTGIPNLIKLFSPFTNRIVFMHFGSWFYKDVKKARKKITALGKESKINTIVGYDGMELDLKDL